MSCPTIHICAWSSRHGSMGGRPVALSVLNYKTRSERVVAGIMSYISVTCNVLCTSQGSCGAADCHPL